VGIQLVIELPSSAKQRKALRGCIEIEKRLSNVGNRFFLAERKGFEPLNHFWRLHTFQACAFDHSAISP
jgi:hypothetical protein